MEKVNDIYKQIKGEDVLHSEIFMDFLLSFSDKELKYDIPEDVNFKDLAKEEQAILIEKLEAEKDEIRIETLSQILDLMEEKGQYINHKDIANMMFGKKIDENIDNEKDREIYKDIVAKTIDASYDKDPLSGFDDKNSAPLIKALAHVYKKANPDKNTYIIAADLNNLTGGNNVLIKERGDEDLGMQSCDKAISIMLNIYNDVLKEDLGDKARINLFREGGDEFGMIIEGDISRLELMKSIMKADAIVERFIAFANLNDMEHTKYAGNKYRNGMSVGLGVIELRGEDKPYQIFELLEDAITLDKTMKGTNRQGQVIWMQIEEELNEALGLDPENRFKVLPSGIESKIAAELIKISEENRALSDSNFTSFERLENLPDEFRKYVKFISTANKMPVSVLRDETDKRSKTRGQSYIDSMFAPSREIIIDNFNRLLMDTGVKFNNFMKNISTNLTRIYLSPDYSSTAHPARLLEGDVQRFETGSARKQKEIDVELKAKMLVVNIENLKIWNTFGHHYGDAILKDAVGFMRDSMKEHGIENTDAIYTKGGGKFAILLPPTFKISGKEIPVDDEFMKSIMDSISKKIKVGINDQNAYDYFKNRNLSVDYNENSSELQGSLTVPVYGGVEGEGKPIYNRETGEKILISEFENPTKKGLTGCPVFMEYRDIEKIPNFGAKFFKAAMAQIELRILKYISEKLEAKKKNNEMKSKESSANIGNSRLAIELNKRKGKGG